MEHSAVLGRQLSHDQLKPSNDNLGDSLLPLFMSKMMGEIHVLRSYPSAYYQKSCFSASCPFNQFEMNKLMMWDHSSKDVTKDKLTSKTIWLRK